MSETAKPALVVLAAGIGSRYGGLKQMDPVGPSGEFIIDYSIHDAVRAGFGSVVFVIRKAIEPDFRATIGQRIGERMPVRYVFQELNSLPPGCSAPEGRGKPWGTGHAVLLCGEAVGDSFAVINADDFYGRDSFEKLADFLRSTSDDPHAHAMVGFSLQSTLSPHGTVARGICRADGTSRLQNIEEVTGIGVVDGRPRAGNRVLDGSELVSMNMWGFKTSVFQALDQGFRTFLRTDASKPGAEFYLPAAVQMIISSGSGTVTVLPASSSWMGMTNREDRAAVSEQIAGLIASGAYPHSLWGSRTKGT
ncbi:MAG: nucleotidyltransferase [Lentisphaerae bacterium]|nr:nucleotidyltransferase [Lentisphaerota bacterium]